MCHSNWLHELFELSRLFKQVVVFVVSRLKLSTFGWNRESLAFVRKFPAVVIWLELRWVDWVPSEILDLVVLIWYGGVVWVRECKILRVIILRDLLKNLVLAKTRNLLELWLALNITCEFWSAKTLWSRLRLGPLVILLRHKLGLVVGLKLNVIFLKKWMRRYKTDSLGW